MQPKTSFLEKLLKKQFPTLVGIGILLVALVAGIFLLSGNTNVFSPRATPQTTPKNVKITNLTDSGFTISFLTDEKTAGFIKYGTDANTQKSQISDDRDQLSGSIGQFNTHHISLRSLQPNTTYYYVIGTGSGTIFDNAGSAFTIKTLAAGGTPSAARTIYGKVLTSNNAPADGSIVYVTSSGIGELSGLVKDSASWAIPLSSARKSDGSYAQMTNEVVLNILAQGDIPTLKSTLITTVMEAQPLPDIILGSNVVTATATPVATPDMGMVDEEIATEIETNKSTINPGGLTDVINDESNLTLDQTLDLTASSSSKPVINSTQPTITGKVLPSVTVSVTINSDTQIQQDVVTDSNGDFVVDLSQLEAELEPGEHTVTYCYNDPRTSEQVCATQEFTVADTSTLLAQADTGGSYANLPYGSGNPYSIGASDSAEASESSQSTSKGGKSSLPSTASGIPVSGSAGTTFALVLGGLFFIFSAVWSYYLAIKLGEIENQ